RPALQPRGETAAQQHEPPAAVPRPGDVRAFHSVGRGVRSHPVAADHSRQGRSVIDPVALDAAAAELIRAAGRPEVLWWEHLSEYEREAWRSMATQVIETYQSHSVLYS